MSTVVRKPRIALMGEFSAGKSTLSNLLLGARPLPEKVTATRLSPVWMTYGTEAPYRIDMDGSHEPVELEKLEDIDLDATRVIRLAFEADILEVCDLIDFPGISDPNMSSEVWQRMLDEVDAVLWCTHATQAWRQSEAAVWDTIPEAVRERSVLLVTRFDKLVTERDRYRVLARLNKETDGLFGATFPISLTNALAAGDDEEAFVKSGGGAFLEHLIPLIADLEETVRHTDKSIFQTAQDKQATGTPDVGAQDVTETVALEDPTPETNDTSEISAVVPDELPKVADTADKDFDPSQPVVLVESSVTVLEQHDNNPSQILPRRVRLQSGSATERPVRPKATAELLSLDTNHLLHSRERSTAVGTEGLRSIFDNDQGAVTDKAASS